MTGTIAHALMMLSALAVLVVVASSMAKRHLAWWLLGRAFFEDNMRAERERWAAEAAERRRRFYEDWKREASAGPVNERRRREVL